MPAVSCCDSCTIMLRSSHTSSEMSFRQFLSNVIQSIQSFTHSPTFVCLLYNVHRLYSFVTCVSIHQCCSIHSLILYNFHMNRMPSYAVVQMNNGVLVVAPSLWLVMNSTSTSAVLYWPRVVFSELREMIEDGDTVHDETWFMQQCQIMMCDIPDFHDATRSAREMKEALKKNN